MGTFQAAANKISYIFKCQLPSKLKGYGQSTGRNFSVSELLSAKGLPPLCVPPWHRTNIRRSHWSHQINLLCSLKLHSKSTSMTTSSLGLPVGLWQTGKPSEHRRGRGLWPNLRVIFKTEAFFFLLFKKNVIGKGKIGSTQSLSFSLFESFSLTVCLSVFEPFISQELFKVFYMHKTCNSCEK